MLYGKSKTNFSKITIRQYLLNWSYAYETNLIHLFQVIMGLLKFWPKVHSPKEVSSQDIFFNNNNFTQTSCIRELE